MTFLTWVLEEFLPSDVLECGILEAVHLELALEGDLDAGYGSHSSGEYSCDLGLGLDSGEGVTLRIIES